MNDTSSPNAESFLRYCYAKMELGPHGPTTEAVPCRAQGVYILKDANIRHSFSSLPEAKM
jgi:hypothetical protein